MNEGSIQLFKLDNTNGRGLSFHGWCIGSYKERTPSAFIMLDIYLTIRGAVICTAQYRSPGIYENKAVEINSVDELFRFFGFGEVANNLYKKIGLSPYRWIE